jgi:GntR family transcriptional regulator, rspAB operon transcriptional repressor
MRPRDQVYAGLKRRILLNELKPEAPLTELGVALEMGCSQGTVREALMRLQDDGLVMRKGHRGTTVMPLDGDAAVEMLALRRQIETHAAPRAARVAGPEALVQLRDILSRMEAAALSGDAYSVIELDTAFHMTLYRQAGFKALEQILLRLILHTHRHKLWEPRHNRPLVETARRHAAIITALQQGEEALAAALGYHIDTIVDVSEPLMVAS